MVFLRPGIIETIKNMEILQGMLKKGKVNCFYEEKDGNTFISLNTTSFSPTLCLLWDLMRLFMSAGNQ